MLPKKSPAASPRVAEPSPRLPDGARDSGGTAARGFPQPSAVARILLRTKNMELDSIYDLGEVRVPRSAPTVRQPSVKRPAPAPRSSNLQAVSRSTWSSPVLVPSSVTLLVPGGGHLLQGRFKSGIALLGSAIFLGAAMAGMVAGLPRLWKAAGALGLPPEASLWALGGFAGLLVGIQVVSVLSVRSYGSAARPLHPAISCAASGLVPGWGQILNGDLVRGGLFLLAGWMTAATWMLASTPFQQFLDAYRLHLPELLSAWSAEPTCWALTAALWPLAVYDAGASAYVARR